MKIRDDIRYVGVNDHDIDLFEGQYVVPRGVVVKIPRKVKEVIENAIKQRNISFGMQEKMKDDFAKQEEKQTSGGYAVTL